MKNTYNQRIDKLFETQVRKTPNDIALVFDNKSISYFNLNAYANQLAHYFTENGVIPGLVVGISTHRSIETIACLLGILKAGAAYLPLDPDYPNDRIDYMIEDSKITHLVINTNADNLLHLSDKKIHLLNAAVKNLASYSQENIVVESALDSVAYVLYTSGSTGKPKGVMGTHSGTINRFLWMWKKYPFKDNDVCCQKTTLNFGDSIWEIFGPLLQGKKLVIMEDSISKDPKALLQHITQYQITRLVLVPSLLQSILDYAKTELESSALNMITISGEAPTHYLLHSFFSLNKAIVLLNLYGSTEVSADVTYQELSPSSVNEPFISIGKPIANMHVLILDETSKEVALGEKGEICVSGPGLAKGYLNNDALTNKSFEHCDINGEKIRVYKTGDIGFKSDDGSIGYVGRKDSQIKLRGYRIELTEIETKLVAIPGIKTAVVLHKQDAPNLGWLEAYLQAEELLENDHITSLHRQLHEMLLATLPEYMIPAKFHFVRHMPLTPSGKINRIALAHIQSEQLVPIENEHFVAPENLMEQKISAIWCALLQRDKISIHDNLFHLGAHSLLIVKFKAIIQSKFDITLPIKDLYTKNNIARIASFITTQQNASEKKNPDADDVTDISEIPASSGQKRMYILDKIMPEPGTYNVTFEVLMKGDLNIDILKKTIGLLVERHDSLRTYFTLNAAEDLLQEIKPSHPNYIEEMDQNENDYAGIVDAIKSQSFDLTQGPLFKTYLITLSNTTYSLILSAHHSIIDGYSMDILLSEIMEIYNALLSDKLITLPKIKNSYAHYSQQQQRWFSTEDYHDKLSFWKNYLQEAPELTLPDFCYKGNKKNTSSGETLNLELTSDYFVSIKDFSRKNGLSLFTCMMAVFAVQMQRYSNQSDLIIGFPIADRQYKNSENVVGLFVNTLPLRVSINPNQSFKGVLENIHNNLIHIYDNQSVPFDKIVDVCASQSDRNHHPLFQVMFAFENISMSSLSMKRLRVECRELPAKGTKFGLTLTVQEFENQMVLNFDYSSDVYSLKSIQRMAKHYQNLLTEIIEKPDCALNELCFLTDEEKLLTQSWQSQPLPTNDEQLIPLLIEKQARQNPGNIAVQHQEKQITYETLNKDANRLAYYLQQQGAGVNRNCLISLHKSTEMIIAVLAIMKSGAAFIPVDPGYPDERIDFITQQAAPQVLLVDSRTKDKFKHMPFTLIDVEEFINTVSHDLINYADMSFDISANALAYIIYTSGSTGTPKGVEITHGAIASAYPSWESTYQLEQMSSHLQMASFGFDVFVGDFIRALCSAAKLVLCQYEELLEPAKIYHLLDTNRIECAEFVPAVVRGLAAYMEDRQLSLPHLKILICGSDTWSINEYYKLKKIFGKNTRIINSYGLTEAGIDSAYFEDSHNSLSHIWQGSENIPLGNPYPNTSVHILQGSQPAPMGVTGELCISGPALARGYHQRDFLTKERFCLLYPEGKPVLFYRTGDLAKYTESGHIQFLGRNDLQIKLNGYRVDLHEIELRLKSYPSLSDAKVIVVEKAQRKVLAAFCIANKEANTMTLNDITDYLSRNLPFYMVPNSINILEHYPLTPNGKVDRKALEVIASKQSPVAEIKGEQPRTKKQKILQTIWEDLLKIDINSIHDNFFRIGGDSILCISMLTKASKQGLQLSAVDIFKNPTIASLAKAARFIQKKEVTLKPQQIVTGITPLLPIQHWFFQQNIKDINHWSQYIVLNLDASIDFRLLLDSISYLRTQHDTLRNRFYKKDDLWQQETLKEDAHSIPHGIMKSVLTLDNCLAEMAKTIDISQGQVFAARLIRGTPNQPSQLILMAHHLVVDGVSWRIITDDLMEIYSQRQAGKNVILEDKTHSFQQWSDAVYHYAHSETVMKELTFWQTQLQGSANPLPLKSTENITSSGSKTLQICIDKIQSKQLLGQANNAWQTQTNDLLISALVMAISKLADSTVMQLGLMLEGHGREPIVPDVDISKTVGWFTSEFPVSFSVKDTTNVANIIKLVKETLRAIPMRGIGYGLLKYLNNKASELKELPEPSISFNHLGQWVENSQSTGMTLSDKGIQLAAALDNHAGYLLEIETLFINGQLQVEIMYSEENFERSLIESLANNFGEAIRELVDYCSNKDVFGFTPSDFSACRISQDILDNVFSHKLAIDDIYPLSPLQQGLLFHHIYHPESDAYLVQTVIDIDGALDFKRFKQAFEIVCANNPIMRTGFIWKDLDTPLQYVVSQTTLDWKTESFSDNSLQSYLEKDRKQTFNLSHWQLQRFRLLDLSKDKKQLLWTHHHILLDGWSTASLLHEVLSTYDNLGANRIIPQKNRLSYRDYITQINELDSEKARQFWSSYLQNIEYPTLLNDYYSKPKDNQVFAVDSVNYHLDETLFASLKQLENTHGLTLNSILLGIWAILLHHYTQQDNIITGTIVSGRSLSGIKKVKSTIGLLANSIPMLFNFGSKQSVLDFFQQVQNELATCNEYSYLALSDIQNCASTLNKGQLFDTLFVYENFPEKKYKNQEGLVVSELMTHEKSEFPLAVIINPAQTLEICLAYHCDKMPQKIVNQLLQNYLTVLEHFVKNPFDQVHELSLLTKDEFDNIVHTWNQTYRDYPHASTLHEQFEQQVIKTPHKIALEQGDVALSYDALNKKANQLARYLYSLNNNLEMTIGISLNRSTDFIVAMFACLKIGARFVPLDPSYPLARLSFMLEDSNAEILITDSQLPQKLSIPSCSLVYLDIVHSLIANNQNNNLNLPVTAHHLAYMIYTSGTTGMPKGVLIEHHSVINLARAQIDVFQIDGTSRILNFAPFSFDASISEVITTLLSGACLVLLEKGVIAAGEVLEHILEAKNISTVTLPPAVLATIDNIAQVKTLIVAGDKTGRDLMDKWHSHVRLINAYGPTENTVCASMQVYDPSNPLNTIGKPISNVTCYILDRYLKPVPVGVTGHLYLGGVGLARGYHNREQLTLDKFINHPFSNNKTDKIYHTGDLARFLPDGKIEYMGRRDEQIKIRGFRVELEEIEAVIRQDKRIENVAVVVQGTGARKSLSAFVVIREKEWDNEVFKKYLTTQLPDFMIPNTIILLDEFPLSPSGKIDRKELANQANNTNINIIENDLPNSITEIRLIEIVQDLLDIKNVTRHDNFLALGGNSILCLQLISRIHKAFSIKLPLATVLQQPLLCDLAKHMEQAEKINRIACEERIFDSDKPAPLSAIQRSMLFLSQMQEAHISYTIPVAYKLSGDVDFSALRTAFDLLIQKHAILRTAFHENNNHQFYQHVYAQPTAALQEISCTNSVSIEQEMKHLVNTPFDMTKSLMRMALLHCEDKAESILLMIFHHAIFDEWSIKLLIQEVSAAYNSLLAGSYLPMSMPTLQYADYAIHEQNFESSAHYKNQLNYWEKNLASAPELLSLPFDYPYSSTKSYQGDTLHFNIDEEDAKKIIALSAKNNATLFMTMLSLFTTFLYRYTNEPDIVVGTPITTRRSEDYESLIGCFINTLALRNQVNGRNSFLSLLKEVRNTCLAAYDNQDVPFDKVVDALSLQRDLGRTPLFQVMLVLEEEKDHNFTMTGLESKPLAINNKTAKSDLILTVQLVKDKGLSCSLEFSSDHFKQATIERMSGHFVTLIKNIVSHPEQMIDQFPLLSPHEKQTLLQSNNEIVSFPARSGTLHEWFAQQALQTPNNTAVVYENQSLTYQELHEKSNQLAHFLQHQGIGAENRVALALERSIELIIAIIAILKSGACYVPVDPSSPKDRLLFILADANTPLLLTGTPFKHKFKRFLGKTVCIDNEPSLSDMPIITPDNPTNTHNLAYIIYTSGSTGKPKGVMVSHNNAVRLFAATQDYYGFNEHDNWTLFHSYAFDFSVWEIWGALLYGGTLHVISHHMSRAPNEFYQYLSKERITVLNQTPSAFAQLITHESHLSERLPLYLRYVIFGGEALNVAMLKPWFDCHGDKSPKIINMYGITETTVHVTYGEINQSTLIDNKGSVIGQRIPDLQTYILNSCLEPVPVGVCGELYVGGAGVSRGYLNREALTKERFLISPFQEGTILYKTGDYARYNEDGSMEYLGRIDDQVKIRGFRIELGEIEAAIRDHSGIQDVAVIVLGSGSQKMLAAFLVSNQRDVMESKSDFIDAVRANIITRLPEYMVPAHFQWVNSLPLTINGKLDKKALIILSRENQKKEDMVAPRSELEMAISTIWCDVLQINALSIHDNFFRLGGNSINSYQIIATLQKAGYSVTIRDLFSRPTVDGLCHVLQSRDVIESNLATSEEKISFETIFVANTSNPEILDSYPLSSMQKIMFKHYEQNGLEKGVYHSQLCYTISTKNFIQNIFKKALQIMVDKHSCFNIGVNLSDFPELQFIRRKTLFHIDEHDLSSSDAKAQEKFATNYMSADRNNPFDLHDNQKALFRFSLFYLDEHRFQLFISLHHAIEDGWGMVEFLKDLFDTYDKLKNNMPCDTSRQPNVHRLFVEHEIRCTSSLPHQQFWNAYLDYSKEIIPPFATLHASLGEVNSTIELEIPKDIAKNIREVRQHALITLKSLYLSSVVTCLATLGSAFQPYVGVVCNGGRRPEIEGSLNTPGLFWNMLPMKVVHHKNRMKHCNNIHHDLLMIDDHALYPLSQIEKNTHGKPLFYTTFNYIQFHNMKELDEAMNIVDIKGYDKFHYPFNIVIGVDDKYDKVELRVDYDRRLISENEAQEFINKLIEDLRQLSQLSLPGPSSLINTFGLTYHSDKPSMETDNFSMINNSY